MGQFSSKSLEIKKGNKNNRNIEGDNGSFQEQYVRKCGVRKLANKKFQIILHLNNHKYYQLQYQQQEDGQFSKVKHGYLLKNLIMQQYQQHIMDDNLELKTVLSHYEQSSDPKSFLSKIIENFGLDFDAIQILDDFHDEVSQNSQQKFTQVYKVNEEQYQLIFVQSTNLNILVKLNSKKVMKTSQQYVCTHSYKLRNPLNQKEILEKIQSFNNVDDLIDAIKQ